MRLVNFTEGARNKNVGKAVCFADIFMSITHPFEPPFFLYIEMFGGK
jgi:hypothetical protein